MQAAMGTSSLTGKLVLKKMRAPFELWLGRIKCIGSGLRSILFNGLTFNEVLKLTNP